MKRRIAPALLVTGCTVVIDVDVGAGIGATCQRDDQCQGSSCLDGICTRRCADDAGCPGGTACANGICELPMRAGFSYRFPIGQDELAQAFDLARTGAEQELGYLVTEVREDSASGGEAVAAASEMVDAGASVVVNTATTQNADFIRFAEENAAVTVVAFQSPEVRPNLVSFDARSYQAYFLAGYAAGKHTAGRIGIIGSVVNPSIVASINGFALGAQRARGAQPLVVEVKWIGDWHDLEPPVMSETRERRYTRELVMNGADVVAHTLDNNAAVFTIADLVAEGMTNLRAIASLSPTACDAVPGTACLGSAYVQFTPLFTRILTEIHREELGGGFVLEGISGNVAESVVGFAAGPALGAQYTAEIDQLRQDIVSDPGVSPVFDGPINSAACSAQSGQTPCVAMGERLSDDGLASMCWFVDGIVENAGMDVPAVVPAECSEQ